MSFDLFLQAFANGEQADASREGVGAVLYRFPHDGPGTYGFYRVPVYPDGGTIEFAAGGLDGSKPFQGASFHLHGFGMESVAFIFEIAQAGRMVIFNPQAHDTPLALLPPGVPASDLPSAVDNWGHVASADALMAALSNDFARWASFRDSVVGRGSA